MLIWKPCARFQSTLPARGATPRTTALVSLLHFNPRSPHGERPGSASAWVQTAQISIHAPRTGSDYHARKAALLTYAFQSTLPARGATWYRDATRTDEGDFNPRSPHGERHGWMLRPQTVDDFNPRSPHGERPNGLRARRAKLDFNPRSPHGERHCKAPRLSPRGTFQSTLPARGATPRRVAGNRIVSISIHAPRTGSDARTSAAIPDVPISIHAPRTGSDTTADRWFAFFPAFQSTLPARGATCSGCSRPIQPEISIHAPRTGSDQRIVILPAHRNHFNPRSPHGERLMQG